MSAPGEIDRRKNEMVKYQTIALMFPDDVHNYPWKSGEAELT